MKKTTRKSILVSYGHFSAKAIIEKVFVSIGCPDLTDRSRIFEDLIYTLQRHFDVHIVKPEREKDARDIMMCCNKVKYCETLFDYHDYIKNNADKFDAYLLFAKEPDVIPDNTTFKDWRKNPKARSFIKKKKFLASQESTVENVNQANINFVFNFWDGHCDCRPKDGYPFKLTLEHHRSIEREFPSKLMNWLKMYFNQIKFTQKKELTGFTPPPKAIKTIAKLKDKYPDFRLVACKLNETNFLAADKSGVIRRYDCSNPNNIICYGDKKKPNIDIYTAMFANIFKSDSKTSVLLPCPSNDIDSKIPFLIPFQEKVDCLKDYDLNTWRWRVWGTSFTLDGVGTFITENEGENS
jgi:hypothetical protein